ncbi:DUF2789 domain-containing protein [Pseudomonas sp. WS 5059]|jgi:hypothetical protein|uniref:DUF2789 domain-containing protein n=1 Tax=unclassified Pseudomonas TaxID=196821 RepID=UPI00147512A2|nr:MULTISPECIES: DUF2789 domain-containing protein [unclassified Pseudomonas]NMX64945.1 DUF2789 domain-containing protein [Pseudomonas sp. WS 5079]NMX68829.1 DUF2789 domain-containing protein [Pseudomonas sp. WS 5111]NMX88733.1 DUF2789 domain-containing protein [Pseudomonas sp. WS 5010]NMY06554.1 DUF2789 domain-containing protein [Pseudomonas sp. WS 5059]NMY28998.1 DUF2789 domain-containing protein [Pseudomonas sp. WS 5021]
MDAPTHTLQDLFEQLGLEASPAAIDTFIGEHPLAETVKLIDAPFWTPQQAQFLKEELREDADWAIAVDELNQRLHQSV